MASLEDIQIKLLVQNADFLDKVKEIDAELTLTSEHQGGGKFLVKIDTSVIASMLRAYSIGIAIEKGYITRQEAIEALGGPLCLHDNLSVNIDDIMSCHITAMDMCKISERIDKCQE